MRDFSDIRIMRRGTGHDPKHARICGMAASFVMPTTAKKTTKTTKTGT
ncbi:hypothetical protein [Aestuariispira ectoiniformans]|nr:hypothetical protein [Aestuariispira ectoiniformans]